jgi:hypothetical protein
MFWWYAYLQDPFISPSLKSFLRRHLLPSERYSYEPGFCAINAWCRWQQKIDIFNLPVMKVAIFTLYTAVYNRIYCRTHGHPRKQLCLNTVAYTSVFVWDAKHCLWTFASKCAAIEDNHYMLCFCFRVGTRRLVNLRLLRSWTLQRSVPFICFDRFCHLQDSIRTAAVLTECFHSFKEVRNYELTILVEEPVLYKL